MKKNYKIRYWQSEEEVHFSIFDLDNKCVHSETLVGEWENTDDIELTLIETAYGYNYKPVIIDDTR